MTDITAPVAPLTAAVFIGAIAASKQDPILYVIAGAVLGGCIIGVMADGLSNRQRLARTIVSVAFGFVAAIGTFASMGLWGSINITPDVIARVSALQVGRITGYSMMFLSTISAMIAWPIAATIERRAPALISDLWSALRGRLVGSASAPRGNGADGVRSSKRGRDRNPANSDEESNR